MVTTNKRPKIALITALTLKDKRSSWRLTNTYMAQALDKYCGDVTTIEPIDMPEILMGKIYNAVSKRLFKQGFLYYHSIAVAKKYAQLLQKRLSNQSFDLIFAPSCATEIAFLKTHIPIVLVEGANFASLLNYYPQFTHLSPRSIREANTVEQLGLQKASLIFYASRWGAESALKNYTLDPHKVHILPYGANLANPPARERALQRTKSGRCQLLFIGVDWQRKGGDIAFETLLELEKLGIAAHLVVCGCMPPPEFTHERMRVIPYLNTSIESERRELENLFLSSDFFFLPTRAEAFGLVYSEASAYGLPTIATDTGGVSGAITHGVNGFLLPLSARGSAYAQCIADIYRDDERYARLVTMSRHVFEQRLNWDAWGKTASQHIAQLLPDVQPSAQDLCLA